MYASLTSVTLDSETWTASAAMLVQAVKAGVKSAACPTITFNSHAVFPLLESWLAERV